ncbi:MAG TPA: hypothetical protein VHE30_16565 [Polyangiaceae bacterium]|nr:hypothetical protein [Polyangiaceae bacterium]
MVRYTGLFALLLSTACGAQGGGTGTDPNGAPEATEAVGKTEQKAQFADNTVVNLVDPLSATLSVTADINPVDVNVFYVSDKTTNSGHQVGTVTLVDTLSLAANQTKVHNVNLQNAAFNGGYGALFLDSIGSSPDDVFQTYVEYGGSMFSVGGSVFTGGSYRIPYRSGTIRTVLVLTNQSDFDFDLTIENVGGTQFKTITLPVLSTYKFDTLANGWFLSGTSSIQITTTNGGVIALSGYTDRLLNRVRITPVKAAPFFQL